MTTAQLTFPGPTLELFAAAEAAIVQIPPAFPLNATVAVNPFLGQIGLDRATAAARLAKVGGQPLFQDRGAYAAMIDAGRIGPEDLAAAAARHRVTPQALRDAARTPRVSLRPLPTAACLAEAADGIGWAGLIEERIGLWAAAHFDAGQALWPAPGGGVYASWRGFASRDLTPGIAGLPGFAAHVAGLPDDPRAAFAHACESLGLTPHSAPLYFHRLLMSLGGWAQYARHLHWLSERDSERDNAAFELLTVRLIWDAALRDKAGAGIADNWQSALADYATPVAPGQDDILDAALQEAADRAAERRLGEQVAAARPRQTARPARPAIQAAFCIDVRSEVLRRALESVDDGIQTIGFAGFFGLATSHRAWASDLDEARAPVLLRPAVETRAGTGGESEIPERIRRRAVRAWGRFKMAAVSAFAFVEAAGPLYVGKLVKDASGHHGASAPDPAPSLDLPLEDRVTAAAQILRAMSLTEGFARLVLIAGHGAHVTNAPHASALQCGACGGHAGDVNARLLAGLLNDDRVRDGLREQGIAIPEDTLFVAGLHDTVSDRLTLFNDAPAPDHAADLTLLRAALDKAGVLARAERALTLPRGAAPERLGRRGADWSELRPEWGLAGCSAFVAAPRHRSAGCDLGGRAFLHDYAWAEDQGFATLELILTAPVVVASWISLQYYGSSVAPEAFGAGNKLIHNVTGGIGVVEGNGGMLRAGLPWQSVHDGTALRHEPLRLSVVIEAPTEAISGVLSRHPQVKNLFDNGWLSLHAMDAQGQIAWRYDGGAWTSAGAAPEQAQSAA